MPTSPSPMPPATVTSSPRSGLWQRTRLVARVRPRRLTGHQVGVLAILLAALAFYLWTADTSAPFTFAGRDADIYNLLTTAFLHGHSYLPLQVPPGLLHLSNPYDPAQNGPYNTGLIHDLLLRNGHFYSAWGPTAVFVLFLPFRLTGLQMSESFAVVVFSFVGLLCAVKLMHLLVRRLVPATPDWLLIVATAGMALTNVVPFLLRRPAQYEVAISSGYCFEMAGLLLVCSAVLGKPASVRRLAWGSLCIGLAMGCRLSLGAGAAVPLAAAIYLIRRQGATRRILIPALLPVAVCLALLAIYNDIRFGSFGDFGDRYQLAGMNVQLMQTDRLAYLPPGLFSYLLMPPRLAMAFPHIFLETSALYPFPFPRGYAGSPGGWSTEPAGGLLATMPITLFLLLVPWRWRRRPEERPALAFAAGLVVLGLAIMALLAFALWATTQRYEVDYASEFLIAATIVWASVVVGARARSRARRAAATLGVLGATIGAMVGVAVSFTGYYPVLRLGHPGVWNTFEDITAPLATLAAKVAGKAVLSDVSSPFGVDLPPATLTTFDDSGAGTWLGGGPVKVEVVAPSRDHLMLRAVTQLGSGITAKTPLAVQVRSAAGTTSTTRVTGPSIALPITVDTGLNRIMVDLVGSTTAPAEKVHLGSMLVSR